MRIFIGKSDDKKQDDKKSQRESKKAEFKKAKELSKAKNTIQALNAMSIRDLRDDLLCHIIEMVEIIWPLDAQGKRTQVASLNSYTPIQCHCLNDYLRANEIIKKIESGELRNCEEEELLNYLRGKKKEHYNNYYDFISHPNVTKRPADPIKLRYDVSIFGAILSKHKNTLKKIISQNTVKRPRFVCGSR